MAVSVHLTSFDGPLDLLLHLIEKNKVNIYDIPIAEILEQYLAALEEIRYEELDRMSEFMVLASELLDIKCRMLLPKEESEEEEEEDPRSELVRRLLEYKMYKYMAGELRERMEEENDIVRDAAIPTEVLRYRPKAEVSELLSEVTIERLHAVFYDVMKRQQSRKDPVRGDFSQVQEDEIHLEEKVEELATYARKHRKFSFRHMLGKQKGKMATIVMFLAVLEFMKAGYIRTTQKDLFEDIEIEAVEGADFEHITIEGDSVDGYES